MTIPEQTLFPRAGQALTAVIEQIGADQWELRTPATAMAAERTVRDLVASHTKEDRWVGHVIAGGTIEQGKALFDAPQAEGDPVARWREASEQAAGYVRALAEPDRPVHLSFGSPGDFTARDYLQQIIIYHGLQAWDLARLLGVDDTLPDDLVHGMAEMLAPVAEQWRAWGVFGPEVAVPAGAGAQDRLLALTGRARQ